MRHHSDPSYTSIERPIGQEVQNDSAKDVTDCAESTGTRVLLALSAVPRDNAGGGHPGIASGGRGETDRGCGTAWRTYLWDVTTSANASDRLSPRRRAEMLAALSATARDDGSPFDVLVIGGGVTGAGVAVDAASRGLSTAIVELDDWASGTSSRSSNLVHGGLRYLEMLDFRLVWEALHERDLLATRIAPHLVRPQRFLFPLRHRVWERLFIGAGILLYDLMATIRRGRRAMPWHRHVSRKAARERFPSIAHRSTVGAIEYWDATVDDAALVVSLVRTASRYGAVAVSRVRVFGYTTNESGQVNGVRAVDLETQESMEIRATRVIASTGVWTEETEAMTGETPTLEVLASKGAHIAVPRDRIDGDAALIIRTPTSVLFTIPSHSEWVIGTTDTPWDGDLRHPVATATDIDYLLDRVNAVLSEPGPGYARSCNQRRTSASPRRRSHANIRSPLRFPV